MSAVFRRRLEQARQQHELPADALIGEVHGVAEALAHERALRKEEERQARGDPR